MQYELMPVGTRAAIKFALEAMILCRCGNDDRTRLDAAIKDLLAVNPPSTSAADLLNAAQAALKYLAAHPTDDEGYAVYEQLFSALNPGDNHA